MKTLKIRVSPEELEVAKSTGCQETIEGTMEERNQG
jgi:hypothetical protein